MPCHNSATPKPENRSADAGSACCLCADKTRGLGIRAPAVRLFRVEGNRLVVVAHHKRDITDGLGHGGEQYDEIADFVRVGNR